MTPPGWLKSQLKPGMEVMAHESGRGCPVYVWKANWRTTFVVYRPNGEEIKFRDLRAATTYALGA